MLLVASTGSASFLTDPLDSALRVLPSWPGAYVTVKESLNMFRGSVASLL